MRQTILFRLYNSCEYNSLTFNIEINIIIIYDSKATSKIDETEKFVLLLFKMKLNGFFRKDVTIKITIDLTVAKKRTR